MKQPVLSAQQISEGFRSGLGVIVAQALVPDAVSIKQPSLITKSRTTLVKEGKEGVLADFEKAFEQTVSKAAPEAAELIKKELKDVKIPDAAALLSGASNAGSEFLRKAVTSSVRQDLMPLVKKASGDTNLVTKARAVVNAIDERGVKGSAMMITTLEDHVCKQVIEASFKLIATREAAVRANPELLGNNPLPKKVFTQFKK